MPPLASSPESLLLFRDMLQIKILSARYPDADLAGCCAVDSCGLYSLARQMLNQNVCASLCDMFGGLSEHASGNDSCSVRQCQDALLRVKFRRPGPLQTHYLDLVFSLLHLLCRLAS